MSTSNRVTRPKLDRTAPVRTLFAPSSGAVPPPAGPGEANVGRGVQTGYQVIDDYLRQGQDFARTMWTPGSSPAPPDPQQLATRMVQYASDFAAACVEYLQSMAGGSGLAGQAAPVGTAGPFDIGRASAAANPATVSAAPAMPASTSKASPVPPTTSITLDVESSKRTQVSVELKPMAETLPLIVHELRSFDAEQPRLTEVAITAGDADAGEGLVVRLRIPDRQPRGVYSGLIVDTRTNLPRGTMTVRVED